MLTNHRRALGVSIALLGALVFMLITVGRHPPELAPITTLPFIGELDATIERWADDVQLGTLTAFFTFLSVVGGGLVTIPLRIAVAAWLLWRRRFVALATFVLAWAASETLLTWLKVFFHRGRPPGPQVDTVGRFLAMNGVTVARTWGVVELTPNSEYMLATEFFEDAENLGDAEIGDAVIDEGLRLIRQFWDIGVAHRDIKPANLLVQDGRLQLVDVSGLEVRPSPWRQAVDLANMMLTLAVQTDPDRVYARAIAFFSPDEIAEAFACAEGMAVRTELSGRLKRDPRPIMARFKELAPPHAPVSIQRWSLGRIGLTVGAVLGGLVLLAMAIDSLFAGLR